MKPSAQRVFAALMRGEKISIHDSKRLSCGAIWQRIGEITRSPQLAALGLTISSDWGRVKGEKQTWKVWWIDGIKPVSAPQRVVSVQAHTRSVKGTACDSQLSLFA